MNNLHGPHGIFQLIFIQKISDLKTGYLNAYKANMQFNCISNCSTLYSILNINTK